MEITVARHPKMVVFDLDDTLAPSKSRVPDAVRGALTRLLAHVAVCVISGGRFEQFDEQLLRELPTTLPGLDRLHVMPTCGTQYYVWRDAWRQVYAHDLTVDEKRETIRVLEEGAKALGLWRDETWGPVIEDRGSQITFSALGQRAPVDAKKAWDPDGRKKERLRAYAQAELPGLEVRSGGSTSVDVTRRGIDKAYGVGELARMLDLDLDDLLFIGDRLDEGGNDYPVKAMGVSCIAVAGWEETVVVVNDLVDELERARLV
jgi:hypothetical protein